MKITKQYLRKVIRENLSAEMSSENTDMEQGINKSRELKKQYRKAESINTGLGAKEVVGQVQDVLSSLAEIYSGQEMQYICNALVEKLDSIYSDVK